MKISPSALARALSYTLLKPFRKSSSAITKLKGLHKDTAPESGQFWDCCNRNKNLFYQFLIDLLVEGFDKMSE